MFPRFLSSAGAAFQLATGSAYWNVMLLRMMSGIVPGTQSNFVSPMDSARPSSICATYWIQL